jgi:hypothetical protein
MACRNKRRWFVINWQTQEVYAYNKKGELGWVINLPWVRPYLFYVQRDAQEVADANKSSARFWQGKIYHNNCNDNKLRF